MTLHTRILQMSCALALFGWQHMNAQPIEVFGGYTIGKMKPENDSNRATLNGWNSSITGYLTPRFGVTADFAGLYGAANPAVTLTDASVASTSVSSVTVRQYSFMAGPQFRLLRKERFESSIRALFGGA